VNLGEFSVSLAVKDLDASRIFYEHLGFSSIGGDAAQGWLILRNGQATMGLFQGMFEGNLLTFNPPDVRAVQSALDVAGVELTSRATGEEGPAHATLTDPDGNVILLDQHDS